MAKPGGSRRGAGGRRPAKRPLSPKRQAAGTRPAKRPSAAQPPIVHDIDPGLPRTFRLGAVAGATPGRWIDTWKRRMPDVPLELVPVEGSETSRALDDVDAALVRLPIERADLHVIPLYDELPVVVAAADSHLMAADELDPADLEGEVLLTPLDDVLGALDIPGTVTPTFAPLETTADAIATVAAGTGVVVVPMSLARLHHRKDADHRVLRGGPVSTVALVWPRDETTPDIETFVGIVRGRTANSSR
ncbi:MAG: substrate-binding domain-containing protein [Actinomycetota bacterium]